MMTRVTHLPRKGLALAAGLVFLISCQDRSETDNQAVLDEVASLMEQRRWIEGLEKMRELVEKKPDDLRVQRYYGEALIASGQSSLAVWPLSKAMRDPDQIVDVGLLLAQAQTAAGNGIDAIRTATRVLEVDPDNPDALLIRAQARLNENQEELALEDIEQSIDLGGDTTTLDLLRLDALLGLDREEESEKLLAELTQRAEESRESDPASAGRLCAATATFTSERGQIDEARKRFEKCLEGDGVLDGLVARAAVDFFDANGQPERSTELYKQRFERKPDRLDLRVSYTDRLQRVDRAEEAERLLLEATEKQEGAWTAVADFYAAAGNVPKALEALEKAIEASPVEREDWRFSRADFLLALGRVDDAEKALEKFTIPSHRALIAAQIAAARGRLEEAARQFEEGIRLWPDNPDARFLAAHNYERMGKWKEAADHLREAARMDPPHYESSIELAELQRALGDTEGVSFLLLRLADKNPRDARVIEKLVEHAADQNDADLGVRMLTMLSALEGKAGRALALGANRMNLTEGSEAALAMIDRSGLDLLDPENIEGLEARVNLLIGLGRLDEALKSIEQAEAHAAGKSAPRLRVLRASVHRDQGDLDKAIATLANANDSEPTDLTILIQLAALHEKAGRIDVARKLYERAIPIEAEQAKKDRAGAEFKATLELARLELAAGERDEARARLRRILDEDPREGSAAWLLLQSYPEDDRSDALEPAKRRDLALRAAVFEQSAEAREYWKKLNEEKS